MALRIDGKTYTFAFDYIYFKDDRIYMDNFMLNVKTCIMNLLNNDLIGNIYILSSYNYIFTVELSAVKS